MYIQRSYIFSKGYQILNCIIREDYGTGCGSYSESTILKTRFLTVKGNAFSFVIVVIGNIYICIIT